jgi:hypothetical protein
MKLAFKSFSVLTDAAAYKISNRFAFDRKEIL